MARYHDDDHLPSHRATPVKANKEIRALTDGFLASPQIKSVKGIKRENSELLVKAFLRCAYEALGRAPWYLTGGELQKLLEEHLPKRFSGSETFLKKATNVYSALYDHLGEEKKIPHESSVRETLEEYGPKLPEKSKSKPEKYTRPRLR